MIKNPTKKFPIGLLEAKILRVLIRLMEEIRLTNTGKNVPKNLRFRVFLEPSKR